MTYKGILFDFDGVVVKSMEQHFEAWQKAFAEKGVHISSDEFFIMEGQGINTISRKIGMEHGLSEEDIQWVKERKVKHYNQFMTLEYYDYFPIMLKNLLAQNVPMGIVSGGVRERVRNIVDTHFQDSFKCVVAEGDAERGKPFPDPFLSGALKLNLKPSECVVIENAPLGIKGAKAAGMTVIGITTTLAPHFLDQADFVLGDFIAVEKQIKILLNLL